MGREIASARRTNSVVQRGLKHDFTLMAISLIPIGIAINIIIGELVYILKIPLFLNTIGTIVVGMVAGPWVGMVTGGITNLVQGTYNPVLAAFAPVNMAMGLVAGFMSVRGMMRTFPRAIVSGIVAGVVTLFIAIPITVILFGGITGNGTDTITAIFLAMGMDMWEAVMLQKLIVETVDRIICFIVSLWLVKKMSDRFLSKHNYGSLFIKR